MLATPHGSMQGTYQMVARRRLAVRRADRAVHAGAAVLAELTRALPGAQLDARDLGRRAEPHRRTPVAGAAADVELRLLVPAPARPRTAAAAARRSSTARSARRACGPTAAGRRRAPPLRGSRAAGARAAPARAPRSRPATRARQVGAVARHAARAEVVDAGEIEGVRAVADGDALVAQDAHAERRQMRQPLVDAGVVLVVAGDEEDAVARAQRRRAARPESRSSSTLPSTRSPVMATTSGASALVVATISSMNVRWMVWPPTWTSVSCTMVKPSSALRQPRQRHLDLAHRARAACPRAAPARPGPPTPSPPRRRARAAAAGAARDRARRRRRARAGAPRRRRAAPA